MTSRDGGETARPRGARARGRLHAFVREVHGVARRAGIDRPGHLARPWLEQRRAAAEHHQGRVQGQLVDEALLERLADDVASAHDHDVTMGRAHCARSIAVTRCRRR